MSERVFQSCVGLLLAVSGAQGQVQELVRVGAAGGNCDAVLSTGSHVYAGTGPLVQILATPNESTLDAEGSILLEGEVSDLHVKGNSLFVASGWYFHVVDISDPASPKEVRRLPLQATHFDIVDDKVYIAVGGGEFVILDALNPTVESIISQTALGFDTVQSVFATGDLAFVCDQTLGLHIVDTGDPHNVSIIGAMTDLEAWDVVVEEGIAYLAAGSGAGTPDDGGLKIIDVSDPTEPVAMASLPNTDALGLEKAGDRIYLAAWGAPGLWIADVSDPDAPIKLGEEAGMLPRSVNDVSVSGTVAYAADQVGVRAPDVSNPASPTTLITFEVMGYMNGLDISGNHAFIAGNQAGGLYVVDISDPANPREVANLFLPTWSYQAGAAIREDFLFLGTADSRLSVLDVSDPLNPAEVAALPLGGRPRDLVVKGNYAYIADLDGFLRIADVGAPASPTLLSSAATPPTANAVAIEGLNAYIAAGAAGLAIFDISDPSNPLSLGLLDTPGDAVDVDVWGTRAYVADGTGGLRLVDVTNPSSPQPMGFDDSLEVQTVVVDGNRAFANDWQSFSIFDVRDPNSPALAAQYLPISSGQGRDSAAVIANFAYVAASSGGFNVIAIPPSAPTLGLLPTFLNTSAVTISGVVDIPGSFVTAGGGESPAFAQLSPGETAFSFDVMLRRDAVNTISVTTMNEFGLVSLPAIARVVEGPAFPSTPETVTGLAITPNPAPGVALNDSLAFTCTATFSDASMADVTEFVTWEEIGNGELITEGGLYVNTKSGSAQVRAFVAGVFSNVVGVGDGP